jgi:hypothetical protein
MRIRRESWMRYCNAFNNSVDSHYLLVYIKAHHSFESSLVQVTLASSSFHTDHASTDSSEHSDPVFLYRLFNEAHSINTSKTKAQYVVASIIPIRSMTLQEVGLACIRQNFHCSLVTYSCVQIEASQYFLAPHASPPRLAKYMVWVDMSCKSSLIHQSTNHINRIGGLVVKLAVAICFRSIRLAPGSIPGRCSLFPFFFAVVV